MVSAVAYIQLGVELERESMSEIGRDHERAARLGAQAAAGRPTLRPPKSSARPGRQHAPR